MKTFTKTQINERRNDVNPLVKETYVRLFDFFPLLKIETRKSGKTFFLFNILPVFRCKNKENE